MYYTINADSPLPRCGISAANGVTADFLYSSYVFANGVNGFES